MFGFSLQCYSYRLWKTLPQKIKTGAGEMAESLSTCRSGRRLRFGSRIQWYLTLGHLRTYSGLYELVHLCGTHKLTHTTHTYTQIKMYHVSCIGVCL